VALLAFWILAAFEMVGSGPVTAALAEASLFTHAESVGKGLLRLRDVAYFGSFVAVFLYATHQRVESLRWG